MNKIITKSQTEISNPGPEVCLRWHFVRRSSSLRKVHYYNLSPTGIKTLVEVDFRNCTWCNISANTVALAWPERFGASGIVPLLYAIELELNINHK